MRGFYILHNGEFFEYNGISVCNLVTGVLTRLYANTDVRTSNELNAQSREYGFSDTFDVLFERFTPVLAEVDEQASPGAQLRQMYQDFFITEYGCFQVTRSDAGLRITDLGDLEIMRQALQEPAEAEDKPKQCCKAIRTCCAWLWGSNTRAAVVAKYPEVQVSSGEASSTENAVAALLSVAQIP